MTRNPEREKADLLEQIFSAATEQDMRNLEFGEALLRALKAKATERPPKAMAAGAGSKPQLSH